MEIKEIDRERRKKLSEEVQGYIKQYMEDKNELQGRLQDDSLDNLSDMDGEISAIRSRCLFILSELKYKTESAFIGLKGLFDGDDKKRAYSDTTAKMKAEEEVKGLYFGIGRRDVDYLCQALMGHSMVIARRLRDNGGA